MDEIIIVSHVYPKYVQITEVAPRDGLQSEKLMLSSSDKVEFINELTSCGYSAIEVSSFVSERLIPNLADAEIVFESINYNKNCKYSALVANMTGFERALNSGVKNIALLSSASETFCKKNINCSIDESVERIKLISQTAKQHDMSVRVYISCAFDCAYEGFINPENVSAIVARLMALECDEISLADTTGKATPLQIDNVLNSCLKIVNPDKIIMHFHNSCNLAMANVVASLANGIYRFDSSVAGMGGCNFSPRSTGNIATEDLLFMLHGMGIRTDINFDKVLSTGTAISLKLGHDNGSFISNYLERHS